jgi:hypothetical protein
MRVGDSGRALPRAKSTRHALYRELLLTVSEDEAETIVGRLEIRVRGDEGANAVSGVCPPPQK